MNNLRRELTGWQLGYGNSEPSRGYHPRACVENRGSVPAEVAGNGMFRPQRKLGKGDIVATLLITSLITGTSAGDTLIQNIVPIVAACGAVVVILRKFLA